jgi:hypothetical protein
MVNWASVYHLESAKTLCGKARYDHVRVSEMCDIWPWFLGKWVSTLSEASLPQSIEKLRNGCHNDHVPC